MFWAAGKKQTAIQMVSLLSSLRNETRTVYPGKWSDTFTVSHSVFITFYFSIFLLFLNSEVFLEILQQHYGEFMEGFFVFVLLLLFLQH